jgi:ketosteroid isomerase-like protein
MSTPSPAVQARSQARPLRWHVGLFEQFWSAPRFDLPSDELAPDVRGYWPGQREPRVGITAYVAPLKRLLQRVPDFRLEVADHASDGDVIFIHWVAHGTWQGRPLKFDGVDCIRQRDGRVVENRIFCKHPLIDLILEEVDAAGDQVGGAAG